MRDLCLFNFIYICILFSSFQFTKNNSKAMFKSGKEKCRLSIFES